MRIFGGKYKFKKIKSHDDENLRPTSSRVRETIFNLLKHGRFQAHDDFIPDDNDSRIIGRKVLDLFAGTGALGIEALSYGADYVTFIDQDRRRTKLLKTNVEEILNDENAEVINSDSKDVPDAKYYPNSTPVDLVFLDPPYDKNLSSLSIKDIEQKGWLADGAIILVEHTNHNTFDLNEDKFKILDTRKTGITHLTVIQYHST